MYYVINNNNNHQQSLYIIDVHYLMQVQPRAEQEPKTVLNSV